jgi:hypothetical protein
MKIKTVVRVYLTPVRKVIIKKTNNDKFWWGRRFPQLVGMQISAISVEIPQKTKNRATVWPRWHLLGTYPK